MAYSYQCHWGPKFFFFFLVLQGITDSLFQSSHRQLDPCMNWHQVKMQARRSQLLHGMTGVNCPVMTWRTCIPQCQFLPMPISWGLLSSIPKLVGLAWGLSYTRFVTTVLMPSSPMLVGVWQRLNLTTPPTNWSFSPSSGPWLRNFKYLYGSSFDVYTDNNPLTYVLMTAKLDAVTHHWVSNVANYNFQL